MRAPEEEGRGVKRTARLVRVACFLWRREEWRERFLGCLRERTGLERAAAGETGGGTSAGEEDAKGGKGRAKPRESARDAAETPELSWREGSAPWERRAAARDREERRTARCRGVLPSSAAGRVTWPE